MGKSRLDFLVFAAKYNPYNEDIRDFQFTFIIEAKHPGQKLDRHIPQLERYLTSLSVRYGLLINGKRLHIYKNAQNRANLVFECRCEKTPEHIDEIRRLIKPERNFQNNKANPVSECGYEATCEHIDGIRKMTNPEKPTCPPEKKRKPVRAVSTLYSKKKKSRNISKKNILKKKKADYNGFRGDPPVPLCGHTHMCVHALPDIGQGQGASPKSVIIRKKERQRMNKKIAVYHNKGGVGKTTVVTNLAAALSRKGKRVLVIDLDSQANTTFATGLIKFSDEKEDDIRDNNVLKILKRVDPDHVESVIKQSQFTTPEVDVIPSHIELIDKEYELVMQRNAELLCNDNLKFIEDRYDVILIDTPPSLNLYARTALTIADSLIIPSDLKPFANQGLPNVKKFIDSINETRRHVGKEPLEILGILPSKVPSYAKFVQHTLPGRMERVHAQYRIKMMETCIFQREILAQCVDNHVETEEDIIPNPKSVFDFKLNSPSAKEFEALADEIMRKIGE